MPSLNWIKIYDFKLHGPEPQEKGSLRVINIEEKRFCLAYTDKGYFAVHNRCPHAGAWLGEGWCEDNHVVCPVHRWKYNLETGRGAAGQGDYVETYPIKQTEEGVFIGLKKDPWWKIW